MSKVSRVVACTGGGIESRPRLMGKGLPTIATPFPTFPWLDRLAVSFLE